MTTLALLSTLFLSVGHPDLTPAQRSAVRAEVKRAVPQLQELRARARQLIREARAQGRMTPESRQALRDSLRSLRDEARRDLLPSARTILASLTPEQRARIEAAAKARGLSLTEAQLEERMAARLQRRLAMHQRDGMRVDRRAPRTPEQR